MGGSRAPGYRGPLPPIGIRPEKEVAVSSVDPPVVFASLAEIAREASTPKEMYAAICVAATLTVPGCDHASLMICRDGVYSTAAVSDATAREIDKLELALGSGPCLDAIEERTAQIQSDLTASSRW